MTEVLKNSPKEASAVADTEIEYFKSFVSDLDLVNPVVMEVEIFPFPRPTLFQLPASLIISVD